MLRMSLIAFVSAHAACVGDDLVLGTERPDLTVVADVPPDPRRQLDLLFVVDNTDSMGARQLALATSFERLLAYLSFVDGGMPDLHIGVVSTDMGAGAFASGSCTPTGDGGALQTAPWTPECSAPIDPFLADSTNADGRRIVNYAGDLADSFACISRLDTSGCDYEQPLAAVRRALDAGNPDNAGFLRADAVLGIVVITDEDDCTARNSRLYDDGDESLGPPSFRCFEHGVQCEGDDVSARGHPGVREGCTAREDSPLVDGVKPFVDFVTGLKPSRDRIVAAGLMGDPDLVEVAVDLDGEPLLVPACMDGGGDAYPAVRLQGFLDGFPGGAVAQSICQDDQLGALGAAAKQLRKALGTRCLDGDLADTDPDLAGLQPECRTRELFDGGRERELPACDRPYQPLSSSELPCYTLLTGAAACGDFPTQLAVTVVRDPAEAPEPPARVIVECALRD